jgi:transcriptional regulator with XRE-family HTH domain
MPFVSLREHSWRWYDDEELLKRDGVHAARRKRKELATHLGLKEQQIQRYEATHYAGVSLERVQAVAEALGVKIHGRVILPSASSL